MKKMFKNPTFAFINGVILASYLLVFGYSITASEIGYTPSSDKWLVSNIQASTDSLYDGITRANPVGEIISYMGVTAPEYFLPCNGKEYNISEYPYLAEHIKDNFGSYNKFGGNGTTTFKVPDLRGEFLRGWGTNSHSGMGSGSSVGIHQDATKNNNIWIHINKRIYYQGNGNVYHIANADSITSESSGGVSINSSYVAENAGFAQYTDRPTNTSVMYAIRYRS